MNRAFLNWRSAVRPILAGLVVASLTSLPEAGHAAEQAVTPKQFEKPRRAVVPRLTAKIAVDGELSEEVWAKAAVLKPFYWNDGTRAGRESTEIRAWYDAEALYLGWICKDSDIQATFTARDSKFWEEEVAEFFITRSDLSRYYELQWNPLGGVFDAIIVNELDETGKSKKFSGEWGYTAGGMTSAVKVRGTVANADDQDESWQVEVRIPFKDLEQAAPKPGDVWRANFYRFNRGSGKPAELLSWSPTLRPSFHEPSRFGFIEFGN